MGKKSTKEDVKVECPPDNLRCSRTDGRQWRCRRPAMENVKLCEIHYLQGRHRQNKEKVPESLKLQRNMKMKKKKKRKNKNDVVEIRSKKKKKKKDIDVQLELIKMVLQREIEKKKKNVNWNNNEESELDYSEGELRKELPNGVMEIAPVSTPRDIDFHCHVTPRYFRSKNVDRRVPFDNLQDVSNLKKGRRKKCHWCQSSDSWNLIKCSNCQKQFFCMDCIKERYFDTQDEVKMACPVCRGTCTCKDCWTSHGKDSESKDYLAGTSRVDRILHFHYMICILLPVLKQMSEDQHTELETEAEIKGKNISDILIKQVEFDCKEKNYCNYCKTPILNLHRSCLCCSYSLCLRCCQAISHGSIFDHINSSMAKLPDKMDTCVANETHLLDDMTISSNNVIDTSMLHDSTGCNGTNNVSCPPTELGGCGDGHLDLRCVFSLSWIEEMEVKAEEIVCSYDVPEILDKNSSCSLCIDDGDRTNRYKQSQEAARREDSNDNCLFHPTVFDIRSDHFEHFQKHWGKGHPVIVQNVLRSTTHLSWDPLVMFCAYVERSITRYENNKDLLEACLDWWEVEINIRQHFTGSFRCQPQKNDWHETLNLNGWLSSQLFKEHFPSHFAEVIGSLPIQEYMNPRSGLLNIAAHMPEGSAKHDKGPYVYISHRCADKEAYSVLNLSYHPYDVVNMMAHTTDVPPSTEHLTKITKLLKKHRTMCQRGSSKITTEHTDDSDQKEPENIIREGTDFYRRVNRTSYISTEGNNTFSNGGCGSGSDSEKSQSSITFNKTVRSTEMYSVAQWDVFRRQDVLKLLEYLKRHADEFSYNNEYDSKKASFKEDNSLAWSCLS
ncbi:lysine-specific demethylase JMJ28-like [Cicer arietinum]|uniref:lysine-specific demethylase JMJ28-like n=1 Tax=Cicer arietinum TaxID=3827 RepID=UPI003CC6BE6A